jgi:hypothetical protein
MENNIYIKKELITEKSFSELDFDLQEEFGFKYDDEDSQFHEITTGSNPIGTYPIRIDRLISALQNMAEHGATHVELDYHCDHIGYDLAGFSVTQATSEDIEDKLEKERKEREKREKRAELLRQLNELEREDKPMANEDFPF